MTALGSVTMGCATLVLAIIGYAGFPFAWISWYGLYLNAAVASGAIIAGAWVVRSAAGRQG